MSNYCIYLDILNRIQLKRHFWRVCRTPRFLFCSSLGIWSCTISEDVNFPPIAFNRNELMVDASPEGSRASSASSADEEGACASQSGLKPSVAEKGSSLVPRGGQEKGGTLSRGFTVLTKTMWPCCSCPNTLRKVSLLNDADDIP